MVGPWQMLLAMAAIVRLWVRSSKQYFCPFCSKITKNVLKVGRNSNSLSFHNYQKFSGIVAQLAVKSKVGGTQIIFLDNLGLEN
jgi:hypothetical protein